VQQLRSVAQAGKGAVEVPTEARPLRRVGRELLGRSRCISNPGEVQARDASCDGKWIVTSGSKPITEFFMPATFSSRRNPVAV
jgi:hypothetical protein